MKKTIILGLFTLIIISACASQENTIHENTDTSIDTAKPAASTGEVVEVSIEAWQWGFSPKEIRVKQGDTVKITATTRDVTHGISIPEFGFNLNINPGQNNVGEFVATKKGTYMFACSVYCGEGHGAQQGTLIVE